MGWRMEESKRKTGWNKNFFFHNGLTTIVVVCRWKVRQLTPTCPSRPCLLRRHGAVTEERRRKETDRKSPEYCSRDTVTWRGHCYLSWSRISISMVDETYFTEELFTYRSPYSFDQHRTYYCFGQKVAPNMVAVVIIFLLSYKYTALVLMMSGPHVAQGL